MKSCREIRQEAWGILTGRWTWRLIVAAAALQFVSSMANRLVLCAYRAMSITTCEDYLRAKMDAARQGLAYTLPNMEAYLWMVGGACFQMFIMYIFAAIFAFGFAGLLLKAGGGDDSYWFSDAFGGFARPLEVTWLLVLMNLLVLLAVVGWGAVFSVAAGLSLAAVQAHGGAAVPQSTVVAAFTAVALLAVLCALPVAYAYRQAWFVKNERPDASAVECLRASRRMMKGYKMHAFSLDLSYIGWGLLAVALVVCAAGGMVLARNSPTLLAAAGAFVLGAVAFWAMIKVALGFAVSRVVFYREVKKAAGGEVR